ncbi:sulfotransferase [Aequorivita flava]|uniref:Sulfotransferase n=1 Tax=Aequorivita flava TaxID=3114371 RepID=A0AB35YTQ1_9FLAO
MSRRDQELSEKYQKDKRFEKVITSLNNLLSVSQNELIEELEETYPTLHILGAPRSGTTLVSQLISTYLPVGHINNLIAAFWKAPIYGIELSKKLIGSKYTSNFQSDFGRTTGIDEPHEFGYFWNYHLNYDGLEQKIQNHEKNINWKQLSSLLKNMTYSYERPIVFKSFLAGFHAEQLYRQLNKTCFIYIKRNLVDNVLSILKLREKLNGDKTIWGSIKPRQYEQLKSLSVYEQIVGQILCLEHEYLMQLEKVPENNKIIISYKSICENPDDFLQTIQTRFLNTQSERIPTLPNLSVKSKKVSSEVKKEILQARNTILKLFPDLKIIK